MVRTSGTNYLRGIANYSGDSESYIGPIKNYFNSGEYYSNSIQGHKVFAGRMPYYGFVFGFFYLFFNENISLSLLVVLQILTSSISIVCFAKLAKLIFSSTRAYWFVLLIQIVNLYVSEYDLKVIPESFAYSFLGILLYSYYKFLISRSRKQLILSSIFLAFFIVLKPYYCILFLPMGIELLMFYSKEPKASFIQFIFKQYTILVLPILILLSPWIIRNFIHEKKFIPLQQDISAGYGFDKAEFAYRDFVNSFGGSFVHWDKKSAGSYFYPYMKCEYVFPKYAFTKDYTIKDIENVRDKFIKYQINNRTDSTLGDDVAAEFNRFIRSYKEQRPFIYYFGSYTIKLYHFLIQSGSYYFPIDKSDVILKYITVLIKLLQSVIYYLLLLTGFFGLIFSGFSKSLNYLLLFITVYLLILFPLFLGATEWRYFTPFFVYAPLGSYFIINRIFFNKYGKGIIFCKKFLKIKEVTKT